jgi:hypothetical protein
MQSTLTEVNSCIDCKCHSNKCTTNHIIDALDVTKTINKLKRGQTDYIINYGSRTKLHQTKLHRT